MNKVYQKNVDKNKGDCMQAAMATLLNIPYESTPAFIEYTDGFFQPLLDLLSKYGYEFHGVLYNSPDKADMVYEYTVANLPQEQGINGIFYASVISPKYFDPTKNYNNQITHAVLIDKNCNIIHDPNPEYKNLKEYPMTKELGFNGILYVMLIEKFEK